MRHDPAGAEPYDSICNRAMDDESSIQGQKLCGAPSVTWYLMSGRIWYGPEARTCLFGRCRLHALEEPMAPDVVRLSVEDLVVLEVLAS